MTAQEIKKAYQKAKRAYEKRTGDKYTWVMNARQQQLGTATIMCAIAWDFEDRLRRAEKALAGFEKFWEERMADYSKRAKEEKWKNEHTPGWYFGKNDTFWQDVVANTEKLAADKASELESRHKSVETEKKNLAEHGDYNKTLEAAIAKANALITETEVQDFLKTIGGRAFVEPKEHGGDHTYHHAEVYVRFQYTPEN